MVQMSVTQITVSQTYIRLVVRVTVCVVFLPYSYTERTRPRDHVGDAGLGEGMS